MTELLTAHDSVQSRQRPALGIQSNSESANRRKLSALVGTGVMSLGLNSPMGLPDVEQMPAFTINMSRGIPDKAKVRTESTSRNRMDSLMRMPNHKSGTTKFDKLADARTIAPLTSEDIGQFHNLGLMSTLRSQ